MDDPTPHPAEGSFWPWLGIVLTLLALNYCWMSFL